jgi:ferric iron reductase protein FhuF
VTSEPARPGRGPGTDSAQPADPAEATRPQAADAAQTTRPQAADPAQATRPQAADPAQVTRALAAAAAIGPFFALGTDAAGPGWRPATAYYPDGFLAGAQARLTAAEPRVVASIAQQGYAARLWSPVLGSGLLAQVVPDLAGLQIRAPEAASPEAVSPEAVSSLALALPGPTGWQAADPITLAELSYRAIVTGHLEPLALALDSEVAEGLLWGNAASAMIGALSMLVSAHPSLLEPATALAAALLALGRLAGTGDLGVTGEGLGFRRRSCCLYYRLPGGGLCGDCALPRRPS